MKFDKEIVLALINKDYNGEDFKLAEQSEWTQDEKYQYRDTIFEHNNKFYSIAEGREGSPFTDWYYDSEYWDDEVDCDEVEKKEIVKYEWIKVH